MYFSASYDKLHGLSIMATNKTSRTLLYGICFALIFLAGCAPQDDAATEGSQVEDASAGVSPVEDDERRRVRIETVVVEPASFEDVIELTGTVAAFNDATISSQVSGTINNRAPLGDYVRGGRRIVQIDSSMLHTSYLQVKAQFELAQAQFDLAEDTFERQEPLFQDSIISALEFENVRAQYNQAKAQLSQARGAIAQLREELEHTRIQAPFGGTVETYFSEVGEQVVPGTPIVRVVNTLRVKVRAGVPERYANDIEVGTPVRIVFDTYGSIERNGAVSFVGRAINRDNRTFPVEIYLDNPDETLKPEMVATVFLTRDEIEDVLVVPMAAIPLDEEGHSVFVIQDEDGTQVARRRRVSLGASYAGNVVIESGLSAGDEVVVTGQYNLTEGDAVEVVNASDSSVASL